MKAVSTGFSPSKMSRASTAVASPALSLPRSVISMAPPLVRRQQPARSASWQDPESPDRHVRVELDRVAELEGLGVVHVDGVAGGIDVEEATVGAHLERHAGPSREYDVVGLAGPHVDAPELIIADLL